MTTSNEKTIINLGWHKLIDTLRYGDAWQHSRNQNDTARMQFMHMHKITQGNVNNMLQTCLGTDVIHGMQLPTPHPFMQYMQSYMEVHQDEPSVHCILIQHCTQIVNLLGSLTIITPSLSTRRPCSCAISSVRSTGNPKVSQSRKTSSPPRRPSWAEAATFLNRSIPCQLGHHRESFTRASQGILYSGQTSLHNHKHGYVQKCRPCIAQ